MLTAVKTALTQSKAGPETASVDGPTTMVPPDDATIADLQSNVITNPVVRI